MRKNVKALSPVVASIILIAVTVAANIAVAAWMGALTFTFSTQSQEITKQKLKDEGFMLLFVETSGNTIRYCNLTGFISVAHSFNITVIYEYYGDFSFVQGEWRYLYK